ncbi:MAG: hypothetical protein JNK70_11995, partial [Phycisphaerae bacterium]|nr:hypothetical protein [Phycisphaerae bacterium]
EHHFLGAESVPHIHHGGFDYSIDIGRILYSPAIAINTMPTVNKYKTWDIHAYSAQTEVVVVLDHSDDEYWNINHMFDVLAWSQKGFVVAVQGVAVIGMPAVPATEIIEFVKRVYDFGPLADANDFNGDGLVDEHDVTDFNAMYAIYFGRTNCNWVHGDVNQDNTVTLADLLAFNSRRMIAGTPGTPGYTPIPINLGAADPYDALTRP